MKRARKAVLLLLSTIFSIAAVAQRHSILNENIRSLQVVANQDWLALPIIEVGNGVLDINFDDLSTEYHAILTACNIANQIGNHLPRFSKATMWTALQMEIQ